MELQQPGVDWRKTHQWEHGLCGCFDNMSICCLAFWCPCVVFGQTSEGLGKACCCYGCLWLFWPLNWCLEANQRRQVREIRGIPGNCCMDCCLVSFCTLCVLTQEAQEVELLHAQERAREATAGQGIMPPGMTGGATILMDQQGNTVVVDGTGKTVAVTRPPQRSQPEFLDPTDSPAATGPYYAGDRQLQPQYPGFAPPPYDAKDITMMPRY